MKPTLLLLPGTLCDARIFRHQCRALRDLADLRALDYAGLDRAGAWLKVFAGGQNNRIQGVLIGANPHHGTQDIQHRFLLLAAFRGTVFFIQGLRQLLTSGLD